MRNKWTRRRFLETGLRSSILVGSSAVTVFVPEKLRASSQVQQPSAQAFDPPTRELFRAAMDEIIPAGDGMPAASEVGGVEYLDRLAGQSPEVKKALEGSLAALEELTRKEFGKPFVSLSRGDRVKSLKKLEGQPPAEGFARLRDYVYEAYYTQPQVWKLIGYEFYPTNQAGPGMKPFDESVLDKVKKMPKLYREAT